MKFGWVILGTGDPIFLTYLVITHDDQDDFHFAVIGLKQKLEDHPVIAVSGIFCVV